MDFFKRQNNKSTSSNGKRKSTASSSQDLEYYSSSSSTSPIFKKTKLSKATTAITSTITSTSLPNQQNTLKNNVRTQTNEDSAFMEALQASTSRSDGSTSTRCVSSSPLSPPLCISPLVMPPSTSSITSSSSAASEYAAVSSTTKNLQKSRKRKHITNAKESEIGYEPPTAKRQQTLHSLYISPKSVDDYLKTAIEHHSSSECLSTTTEYDVASDDIPDSPLSSCKVSSCVADVDDAEVASSISETLLKAKTELECNETLLQQEKTLSDCFAGADYVDCMTPAADVEPIRQCPLPALSWANAEDVWQLMCKKDAQAASLRHANMLDRHPSLQPRMRAILFDWLIEVCEVYKLHRETYYLAVDYLDRYLSAQKNVQKTHLQLIGITCLFVAAKVEEIYPPKIGEFAYVTDGACQEHDILQTEILLLQALKWQISPVSPMGWLGVYMQLNVNNRTPASFSDKAIEERRRRRKPQSAARSQEEQEIEITDDAFIYPQFSGLEFVHTAQLLDLCTMDVAFGHFPYSIIAAAAMSHTFNRNTAISCSGYDWSTLQECAEWMSPFFNVISMESKYLHLAEQNEQVNSKCGLAHICPNIVTDDSHIIQTHTTTMEMFDRVCLQQAEHQKLRAKIKQEASPAIGLICPEGLLTPPSSSRKPPGEDEYEEQTRPHANKSNNTNAMFTKKELKSSSR